MFRDQTNRLIKRVEISASRLQLDWLQHTLRNAVAALRLTDPDCLRA
jgi:hypothetical protein